MADFHFPAITPHRVKSYHPEALPQARRIRRRITLATQQVSWITAVGDDETSRDVAWASGSYAPTPAFID